MSEAIEGARTGDARPRRRFDLRKVEHRHHQMQYPCHHNILVITILFTFHQSQAGRSTFVADVDWV